MDVKLISKLTGDNIKMDKNYSQRSHLYITLFKMDGRYIEKKTTIYSPV